LQALAPMILIGIWRRRGRGFGTGFPYVVVCARTIGMSFGEAMPFYPGEAPNAIAMCRKVARNGNDCGRCTTNNRRKIPTAPTDAATLPGHNTTEHRYYNRRA
jgi:hypothetical protein